MHKSKAPLRFLILTLATFLSLVSVGHAEQFQVAGKTLSLTPPEGYCLLDRSRKEDDGLTALLERSQAGVNQVLLNFALCTELEDWHAGKIPNLRHFGNVMVPVENGSTYALSVPRQSYVAALAGQVASVDFAAITQEVNRKLEIGQVTDNQFLGALHQDDSAIYIGILTTLDSGGQKLPQAGIAALTLLNSVPASLNMQWPAEEDVLKGLLAAQQKYASALIQANP